MIRQFVNGKMINTVRVSGSSGDMAAITAVLEGRCEIYDLKAEGGTVSNPTALNMLNFSVGKKYISGVYKSVACKFQHIKPTKTLKDIVAAVKGAWDENFESTVKCTYVNGIGSNSKG